MNFFIKKIKLASVKYKNKNRFWNQSIEGRILLRYQTVPSLRVVTTPPTNMVDED
jgi:hypothetical protein